MASSSSWGKFQRQVNEYNRKVARHNRQVAQHNRAAVRKVNEYNRKAAAANRRQADQIAAHNREVVRYNQSLGQGRGSQPVNYRPAERALAERVHGAIDFDDGRDYDVFLSYARIDGRETAEQLRDALEAADVRVWFDAVAMQPGRSMSLQMDAGLRKARAGIALLTPAYIAGRFWTQRELGVLLAKSTLIPVLHGVTFDDVREFSGMLPDLHGFLTETDPVEEIARKIAPAVHS